MAGNFDPSVKSTLRPKGNSNVSMDWNQANIAREGAANENVARAVGQIGSQLQEYAIAEKDKEMKLDIMAINQYRAKLWQQAENELNATPTINDFAKVQSFWEAKSEQINTAVDAELQRNGRWYDDTKNFVENETKEISVGYLQSFNKVQVAKNNQRDQAIVNAKLEEAMTTLNPRSFDEYRNMAKSIGRKDEDIAINQVKFERSAATAQVKLRLNAIENMPSLAMAKDAAIAMQSTIKNGEFEAIGLIAKEDLEQKLGVKLQKLDMAIDANDIAILGSELALMEQGSPEYNLRYAEIEKSIKGSSLAQENKTKALTALKTNDYKSFIEVAGLKSKALENWASIAKTLDGAMAEFDKEEAHAKEVFKNKPAALEATLSEIAKKKDNFRTQYAKSINASTNSSNAQTKDYSAEAIYNASQKGYYEGNDIIGSELIRATEDKLGTEEARNLERQLRTAIYSDRMSQDKNGSYATQIALLINNNLPNSYADMKKSLFTELYSVMGGKNGSGVSEAGVSMVKSYLVNNLKLITGLFDTALDKSIDPDSDKFDLAAVTSLITRELNAVGAKDGDRIQEELKSNPVIKSIITNYQVKKALWDGEDFTFSTEDFEQIRKKANNDRAKNNDLGVRSVKVEAINRAKDYYGE